MPQLHGQHSQLSAGLSETIMQVLSAGSRIEARADSRQALAVLQHPRLQRHARAPVPPGRVLGHSVDGGSVGREHPTGIVREP